MLQTLQVLFVASDSRDGRDSKQSSKPSLTVRVMWLKHKQTTHLAMGFTTYYIYYGDFGDGL